MKNNRYRTKTESGALGSSEGLKSSNNESSIYTIKKQMYPFFQDVFHLKDAIQRSKHLNQTKRKDIHMISLKDSLKESLQTTIKRRKNEKIFKVHQMEWRNRVMPSFRDTSTSSVFNN